MANVYSTQLLVSRQGAPASFQCPAGYRAVLRCVTAFNSSLASSGTGHVIHQPTGITVWQWVVAPPAAVEGAESVVTLLHFVFNAGESLQIADDSSVDLTASGYLLTLP